MAPPAGTLRVGRYFLALIAILAVLYAIVFWPGARHTPKLGLDLAGGQQVVFTAKAPGGKKPSKTSMEEAKTILEDRVNGTGVTEATVVIQGDDQLVVSIPGATGADVRKLGAAAQLSMRGLVMPVVSLGGSTSATTTPSTGATGSTGSTPTGSATPTTTQATAKASSSAANLAGPLNKAPSSSSSSPTTSATPTTSASPTGAAASTGASSAVQRTPTPLKGLSFAIPTSDTAYAKLSAAQQSQLQAALATMDCSRANEQAENAPYYVACDTSDSNTATAAYLLGTVIVPGSQIKSASAAAPNQNTAQWTVNLTFKSKGDAAWAKYTAAHNISALGTGQTGYNVGNCSATTIPCADFVAFTLDGAVISAPVNNQAINGGTTQISGSFTQSSATTLANQLKYGALPLSFSPGISQSVSATLGSSQLKAGLLAGGLGLLLVVIYSLIYYRALGLVTIASLVVSGVLTYGCLVMLGTQIGFSLSLAGIAGFIVAVGITADSFVVFFERLKDEVHDGRSVRVAVPRAWVRARRTILSADTVSFLAAAILYYFAAGDVKGFAFTLGLSTILDLAVVFLFTHPLVSLLSRSRAFGSARFTGLDSLRGAPISDAEDGSDLPRGRGARRTAAAQTRAAAAEDADGGSAAERAARRRGRSVQVKDREQDEPDAPIVEHDTDEPASGTDSVLDGFDTETDEPLAATAGPAGSADDVGNDVEDDPEPAGTPARRSPRARRDGGTAADRAAARRARIKARQDGEDS